MNLVQTIVLKPVSDLMPYVNNAKKHSDAQINKLAASIKEFGFNNPILLDGDNGIIAGHGRLMAAKRIGLKEVPCIELGHLNDAQKKAYILADNRLGEVGVSWDMNIVTEELEFLQGFEIDANLTGFDLSFDRDVADSLKLDNFSENDSSQENQDNDSSADDSEINQNNIKTGLNNEKMVKADKIAYPIYIMASKAIYQEYKQMKGNLSDVEFIEILLESHRNNA